MTTVTILSKDGLFHVGDKLIIDGEEFVITNVRGDTVTFGKIHWWLRLWWWLEGWKKRQSPTCPHTGRDYFSAQDRRGEKQK